MRLTQVTRELGVTLRLWRWQVAERAGATPAGVFPGNDRLASDDEVRRLKRENGRLQ